MRVLFPEAVALVSAARQGFMRESVVRSGPARRIAAPVSLLDSALVRLLPAVPKPVVQLFSSRYIAGATLPTPSRRARPQRRREDGDDRRPRRGDHARGGDARDRPGVPRRLRRDRRGARSTRTSASSSPRSGSTSRTTSAARTSLDVVGTAADFGNFVRIDMEDSSTTDDTLRLYRELREDGPRQPRRRPPGAAAPHARRHPGARGPAAERPSLQGHLPRARDDRVHRLRSGARELPALPRRAARRRLLRRRSRRTTSG